MIRCLVKSRVRALLLLGFFVLVPCVVACSQNNDQSQQQSRMILSTREFNRGRKDGRRDAKTSWTEDHGGWMWLWMMEQQYRRGYDQGWTEGRAELKFKQNQKDLR